MIYYRNNLIISNDYYTKILYQIPCVFSLKFNHYITYIIIQMKNDSLLPTFVGRCRIEHVV